MSETAAVFGARQAGIVTATVRAAHGARVDVESARFGALSARLAVAGAYQARAGDVVLVAFADEECFVVGVVRALRDACSRVVEAPDGSRATLEQEGEGVVWRFHDAEGRLVFEHRGGKSVVSVDDDLELRARGDIALSAGGEVRIEGERAGIHASGAVSLRSEGSELSLDGDAARLRAATLDARTERADLHTREANAVVGTLRTMFGRVRERAEVVERTAGRVVERAREVYREIDELSQTKAGRIRLVARTAITLLGEQTLLQAREDVKIKGEKVYLG